MVFQKHEQQVALAWSGSEHGAMSFDQPCLSTSFGLGFLLMVYPAALYSDRQMRKIEAVEDKFPDFLRDLAEYWKELVFP